MQHKREIFSSKNWMFLWLSQADYHLAMLFYVTKLGDTVALLHLANLSCYMNRKPLLTLLLSK